MLLRNRTNMRTVTPIGTELAVCDLFERYPSFQRESVFVEPYLRDGHAVVYVQLTNEEEMRRAVNEINSRQTSIGAGKLKLSILEKRQTQVTKNTNEHKQDEFRVKLYQLPSHVDERSLIQELNKDHINQSVTHIIVFRKKLPNNYFSDRSRTMNEDQTKALIKLKALFASRDQFSTEPNIEIRSPTEDGRAVAFIRFNDPRDILTAIDMSNSLDRSTLNSLGLNQLHFVPIIVHRILINSVLAQVINNKIEHTINVIQTSSNFSNTIVFKRTSMKDGKTNVLILIRGTNIQELYKARIRFDDLLKGLQFQLYDHSWVSPISIESI